MKRLLPLVVLLSFVLLVLQSCDDSSNNPPAENSYVRLIHMVYDGGPLDVRVNGQVVTSNTAYGESSGYKVAPAGRFDVSVHYAGDANARNSSSQNLVNGGAYTVYACPPAAAFAAAFSADPRDITSDKVRVKLANCSNDPNVKYELWVTGAISKLLGPVDRVQSTAYSDLFAGTYSFSLRKQGDATFSMNFQPVELIGGRAFTFVIYGTSNTGDAFPFGVKMFTDVGDGSTFVEMIPAASTASLLFVNAVNGSSPVAVAIDASQPQITNLPYGSATQYLTFGSGTHQYTVGAGTTSLIEKRSLTLQTPKKYSVFVTGTLVPQNIAPMELEDELVPDAVSSTVRFIHIASDLPELNVVTKVGGEDYFIPGMQNMTYRTVSKSAATGSAFLKIPPGQYQIEFRQPDSTNALYKQSIEFKANEVMTMWLGGSKQNNNLRVYTIKH